jgi:uncharacterized protein
VAAPDPDGAESLLVFPCAYPLKVMGRASDDFVPAMLAIVLRHAPDYDAAAAQTRASSGGAYVSLTCTLNATSRAQLDALYRELTSHPQVVMAL